MQGNPRWQEGSTMPPGREFEAYHKISQHWVTASFHAHDFYEFFFFLRGSAHFVLDGHTYYLQPGDLLLFPAGCMHRVVIDNSDVDYERAYFYVTSSMMASLSNEHFPMLSMVLQCVQRDHLHFHLADAESKTCREQIDAIIQHAASDSPADQLIAHHLFSILLIQVCRMMQRPGVRVAEEKRSVMDELLRYVQAHLGEPIDPETLAARFYMSKFYMLHRFKEHTNMSLHQYLLVQRVMLSQRLLPVSTSATEVASRCGFSDYSCFYRAFRKVTGLSPQQYTKLMGNESRPRSAAPEAFSD